MKKGRKKEEREEEMREGVSGKEEAPAEGEAWIQEIPEEEIKRLRGELGAREKDARENYDRFLRAAADLDNYKKRSDKEKADAITYANEKLVLEILPVMDNLERALEHTEGVHDNLDSLKEGVTLTITQMFTVLKKFGLEEVKAVGERFDPALHHAITHDDGGGAEPGTVLKEFQKGYILKGRLIRPSMVSVAREKEKEKSEETEGT
jgi:molecular chaperone GrpE